MRLQKICSRYRTNNTFESQSNVENAGAIILIPILASMCNAIMQGLMDTLGRLQAYVIHNVAW
jgi:hypothetical protein